MVAVTRRQPLEDRLAPFLRHIATTPYGTFAIFTDNLREVVRDVVRPMEEIVGPGMTFALDRGLCVVFGHRVYLVDDHWKLRGLRVHAVWLHGVPRGAFVCELDRHVVEGGRIYS